MTAHKHKSTYEYVMIITLSGLTTTTTTAEIAAAATTTASTAATTSSTVTTASTARTAAATCYCNQPVWLLCEHTIMSLREVKIHENLAS